MKKLLVIAAVTMLAACKSLFICEVDEAKFTNKEAAALKQQKVVFSTSAKAGETSMFALNSFALTESSKADLDDVAAKLKRNPSVNLEVNGYTDNTGAHSYNVSLSQKRAQAVANYIESKGIAKDRLTANGYGPEKPVASNDTAEGRAQNRRVEVVYK